MSRVLCLCLSFPRAAPQGWGGGCPDVMGWGETMALASLPGRASTLTAHLSDKGPANGVRSLLTPTLVLQRRAGRSRVTRRRCCSGQPVRCRRHPHSPCKEELNLVSLSEHQSHGRLGVCEQTLRGSVQPPGPPRPPLYSLGSAWRWGDKKVLEAHELELEAQWRPWQVPGLLSLTLPAFSN